jgi:hypothetical protein
MLHERLKPRILYYTYGHKAFYANYPIKILNKTNRSLMMESLHTLFLAQAIGLYLVIMTIILLVRAEYYRNLFLNIKPDSMGLMLAATIGLILGIVLILVHNLWTWESEVFVTIIAWITFIKSILWLSVPHCMAEYSHKMVASKLYYPSLILTGIIGVILMAHGFYLFGL